MKTLQVLLACFSFVVSTALYIEKEKELADATTWQELQQTRSMTINSVAKNSFALVFAARNKCRTRIEHLYQNVMKVEDRLSVQKELQHAIFNISDTLKEYSTGIRQQMHELGKRFLTRFRHVINNKTRGQKNDFTAIAEIYETEYDENDELAIFFSENVDETFNPIIIVEPIFQNSLELTSDNIMEIRKIAIDEMKRLFPVLQKYFNSVDKHAMLVVNRVYKGMLVLRKMNKSIQTFSKNYIERILLEATIVSKIYQFDSSSSSEESDEKDEDDETVNRPKNYTSSISDVSLMEPDTVDSSEEHVDSNEKEDDSDWLFLQVKKQILNELSTAVELVKSTENDSTINTIITETLNEFAFIFKNLGRRVTRKIIDTIFLIIQLYEVTMSIMAEINPKTEGKMKEIYYNQSINGSKSEYENIKKYLTEGHLAEKKILEINQQIREGLYGTSPGKQLLKATQEVITELNTMKSVTAYIVIELKRGVDALVKLKENSNITGYRYLFNNYKPDAELAKCTNIMNLINMLNVQQLVARNIRGIFDMDHATRCTIITNTMLKQMTRESEEFVADIEKNVDQNVIQGHIADYNIMLSNYISHTRKILKRVCIRFITIYEETIIIMKRKKIQKADEFIEVLEKDTCEKDSEIFIIDEYMRDNHRKIDVQKEFNVDFSTRMNSNQLKMKIELLVETMKTKITRIDMAVQMIIENVVSETHIMQKMINVIEKTNQCLSLEQFVHLKRIVQAANILQINQSLKSISDTSVEQLNDAFEHANEQLEHEKESCKRDIESCTESKEIELKVIKTNENIETVVLETAEKLKSAIHEVAINFWNVLNDYLNSSENGNFESKLNAASTTESLLSEELQAYLTDSFDSTLPSFTVPTSTDIAETKQDAIEMIATNIETVQSQIKVIQMEAIDSVVMRLSKAVETIQVSQSDLEEEKVEFLISANSLAKCLWPHLIQQNAKVIQSEIKAARELINAELTRGSNAIRSLTGNEIEAEFLKITSKLDIIYSDLRNNIRCEMNKMSSNFVEHYENTIVLLKEQNCELEITFQDIKKQLDKLNVGGKYEEITTYLRSEQYNSLSCVENTCKTIKQKSTSSSTPVEKSLQELNILSDKILESLHSIEGMIVYVYKNIDQSTKLIFLIRKDINTTLNEDQKQNLGISISLSQIISRQKATSSVDFYFSQMTRMVEEEHDKTLKSLQSIKDTTNHENVFNKLVDIYNNICADMKHTLSQKWQELSFQFSSHYESIVQLSQSQQNNVLENVLKDVKKMYKSTFSQQHQQFLAFISISSSENILENIQLNAASTERLETLTCNTKNSLINMKKIQTYVDESFHEAFQIFKLIEQNNSVTLTQEQVSQIQEVISISKALFSNENFSYNSSRSLETENETFKCARNTIEDEYKHTVDLANSVDESKANVIISSSVEQFNTIYNDLRLCINSEWKHIAESYQNSVPENDKLKSLLSNYKEETEEYRQLVSFMEGETYQSSDIVFTWFQNARNSNHQKSISENCIASFESLKKVIDDNISIIESKDVDIQQIFQRSEEIFRKIQKNYSYQPSEEDIRIISTTNSISKFLTSHSVSINITQSVEFADTKYDIKIELQSAVDEIKSLTEIDEIEQTIIDHAHNCDAMYNTLKESVHTKMTEMARAFEENYETTVTAVTKNIGTDTGNTKLLDILQNITFNSENTTNTEKFIEFKKWTSSSYNTSSSAISETIETLKKDQSKLSIIANDLAIRRVHDLEAEVEKQINKLNEITGYIVNTIHRGNQILKSIQSDDVNFELNQEQVDVLSMIKRISQTILISNRETEDIIYDVIEQYTDGEVRSVDFTNAKTGIALEIDKVLVSVQTRDERTMKEATKQCIESCNSIYNELMKQIQVNVNEKCIAFKERYESVIIRTPNSQINIETDIRDKLFQKFENYFSISHYLPMETMLKDVSSQEISIATESIFSVKEKLTNEIDMMEEINLYVEHNFQKSEGILCTLENDLNSQLTEEQTQLLSISKKILEIISTYYSTSINSGHEDVTKTKSDFSLIQPEKFLNITETITHQFQQTIESIKMMTDEKTIRQTIRETVDNSQSLYTDLRTEVKIHLMEYCATYRQIFEKTMKVANTEAQEILKTVEADYHNSETETNFLNLKTCLTDLYSSSSSPIVDMYNKMHRMEIKSSTISEHYVQLTENLFPEIKRLITEMEETEKYASSCLQQGYETLQSVQNGNIQLTETQINNLSISANVIETISFNQTKLMISDTRETDFIQTKSNISAECEKMIEAIKSMDEETADKIVAENVQQTETMLLNITAQTYSQMSQSCFSFQENFTSTLKTLQNEGKINIGQILQQAETDQHFFECETILVKMKSYFSQCSSFVSETYTNIKKSIESAEERVREFNSRVTTQVCELEEYEKYVEEYLQQGFNILEKIKTQTEINLTMTEIKFLSISTSINQTFSSVQQDVLSSVQVKEKEFTNTISLITEESENTVRALNSITDDDETMAEQMASETIRKNEDAYSNIQSRVQTGMSQLCSNFKQTFEMTLQTIQQNGNTKLEEILKQAYANQQYSEADKMCVDLKDYLVNRGEFNFSAKNNLQESSITERSIKKVQTADTEITQEINRIQQMSSYVQEYMQKGSDVLQQIQPQEGIELEEEQIRIISICTSIVDLVLNNIRTTSTDSIGKVDIEGSRCTIKNNFETAIQTIRSTKDEKQMSDVFSTTIEKNEKAYKEIENQIFSNVVTQTLNFERKYRDIVGVEIEQIIQEIRVDNEKSVQAFEQYIAQHKNETKNGVFTNIPENSRFTEVESFIEQLEAMNGQIYENLNQMEKMSEYIDKNFQQGYEILDNIQTERHVELNEEQKTILATCYKITEVFSSEAVVTPPINIGSSRSQEDLTTPQQTEIDFMAANNGIQEKLDEYLTVIDTMEDTKSIEITVSQSVKEHAQFYNNLRGKVCLDINQKSSNFIDHFDFVLDHLPEKCQLRLRLNEIKDRKEKSIYERDQELSKFEKTIHSETFIESTIVESTYESIRHKYVSTDTKEQGVNQLRSLNEKVQENMEILEEADKYVSDNLQKGETILRELDIGETELDDEIISQLEYCFNITKTLTEVRSTWQTVNELIKMDTQSYYNAEPDEKYKLEGVHSNEDEEYVVYKSRKESTTVQKFDEQVEVNEYQYATRDLQKDEILVNGTDESLKRVSLSNLLFDFDSGTTNQDEATLQERAFCQNLSWTDDNCAFKENYFRIENIRRYLRDSRIIINASIRYHQAKLRLFSLPEEMKHIFTNCIESINTTLQRLSTNVHYEMQKLAEVFLTKLDSVQTNFINISTQDMKFLQSCRTFYELQSYGDNDLLDIIDSHKFSNEKYYNEGVMTKFTTLQSIMKDLIDNVNCSLLMSVNTLEKGILSIEIRDVQSEDIKIAIEVAKVINETKVN